MLWPRASGAHGQNRRFGPACQLVGVVVGVGAGRRCRILPSVSSLAARRAAVVVLLALIAGAAFLAHGPLALGSLRLGGVSLLWWSGAAAAPLVVIGAVVAALLVREP